MSHTDTAHTAKNLVKEHLSALALLGWLLAACASPATPAPAAPPTSQPPAQPAATEVRQTDPQAAAPVPGAAPTPTLRADFEATDPSTVALAAGQPQLIEFFAFW